MNMKVPYIVLYSEETTAAIYLWIGRTVGILLILETLEALYWVIGLMKIENLGKSVEINEPMNQSQISQVLIKEGGKPWPIFYLF